jgi:hypothetical protein
MPDERCLSPHELARRWRCRVGKVRVMVKRGLLAAIEINGRVRILPEAVAQAEAGTLAVRPRQAKKREKISAEALEMLG